MTIDDKDMINSILWKVYPGLTILNRKTSQILIYIWTKWQPLWKSSSFLPNVTQMIRFSPRLWSTIMQRINFFPPPEKKRYSKEHVLMLIFIYYFKIFFPSMISRLCSHRSRRNELNPWLRKIWLIFIMKFSAWKRNRLNPWKRPSAQIQNSTGYFRGRRWRRSGEFEEIFSFICLLSFDVYVKKRWWLSI